MIYIAGFFLTTFYKLLQSKFQKPEAPSTFEGSVVYINNPGEFWLQRDCDHDAVMQISAQLADHCNSDSLISLTSPQKGQLCAALYNLDDIWYRGCVVQELDEKRTAKVVL